METTKEQVAAGVIAWARRMGSDTDTVRDAAHEASHAIEFGCARWDRRSIDVAAFSPRNRRLLVTSEVDARALERIVCEELGVPYDPMEWAKVCLLEQAGLGLYRAFPPTPAALVSAIERRMERDEVLERAALVLSLGMSGGLS
jgi:hypothetical protein